MELPQISVTSRLLLYCERLDGSFGAEPANALSNLAFLLAAAMALRLWERAGGRDWPALALIVVVVAVAFGSFVFHTIATPAAMLADVIPIAVFIYGYLLLALRRFIGLRPLFAIPIVLLYAALAQTLSALAPPEVLNGSVGYLPSLIALVVVAVATPPNCANGLPRRELGRAALVFTLSLALRTLDRVSCTAIPTGTHFVWHMLNAVVLYMLLRAAIASWPHCPHAAEVDSVVAE
jgi:hypothetical protein